MFTGLVECLGSLVSCDKTPIGSVLRISAAPIAPEVKVGDSVAVNGCCLTVTEANRDVLRFDLLEETLRRTNLGHFEPGAPVNLERALPANGRLGGHFVQGHVDDTTSVLSVVPKGSDLGLTFSLPRSFRQYVIPKGSIAINGVSLTVAELNEASFSVWIIPHTRAATNLGLLSADDRVNVEFDVLAKYVSRLLHYASTTPASPE